MTEEPDASRPHRIVSMAWPEVICSCCIWRYRLPDQYDYLARYRGYDRMLDMHAKHVEDKRRSPESSGSGPRVAPGNPGGSLGAEGGDNKNGTKQG